MEKSERKKSINIHSDEKGKVIDKEKISLGEISLNTNPEEPFIAFRASGATEDVMVTTVMSARFTTDALGEPTVKNGVLTIPIPKGAQGLQGEKGETGAQGEQGDPGPKGPTGNPGKQGEPGPQGEKGTVGSYGSTGDRGTTGAQGPQGEKGTVGSYGSTGDRGTTGIQGAQGFKGTQGSYGNTGDRGTTGAQGPQGEKGTVGSYGSTGDRGTTGAQGPQGEKGTVGSYGSTGTRGTQGKPGAQGAQGAPGAIGSSGEIVSIGKTSNNSTKTYVVSHTDGSSTAVSFAQNEWYRNIDVFIQSGAVHAQNGFYQDSDERLKAFEDNVNVDFEKLSKLPKKYFMWKNDEYGVGQQIGTSAQELLKLYPELVTVNDNGYYSVNYAGLSIIALAAIDKLHQEIEELKASMK